VQVFLIAALVFAFSGLMAMAGLGAAFLFVPLFYYLGVPLAEATATALFLNVISLAFATLNYWRWRLINWRIAVPVLITAVSLAPFGARLTVLVDKRLLLGIFAGFLVFAGWMMLFFAPTGRDSHSGRTTEMIAGAGVGSIAGFLGGLLGVGGGNFIVPVLNWLGLDPKVAAGTTALVVVFSSLSGFVGHATLGRLDPRFIGLMGVMAAAGSIAGSHMMRTRLSSAQLKRAIGVLLWVIATKMIVDLAR
jgi:uncharacterized membrane protein YfcA